MKKMNKKGFTLVELLAVIVVLAIIMVIAVPSVITAMNSAKQSAFLVYAEKMLNTAQQQYQTDSLIKAMPSTYCYNISTLTESGSTQYQGYVHIKTDGKTTTYSIQMFDATYSIGIENGGESGNGDKATGVTFADIEQIKAKLDSKTLTAGGAYALTSPCGTDETNTHGAVSITGTKTTSAPSGS